MKPFDIFVHELGLVPNHWRMNDEFWNLYLFMAVLPAQQKRTLYDAKLFTRKDVKVHYEAFGDSKMNEP